MKGLGEPDEKVVATYAAKLEDTLRIYDGILAKQRYLAGEELTLADLFHLPYGVLNQKTGFKELYDKYPNTKRWLAELEARESWVKITN
jgi:glutathione S-transferase